MYEFINIVSVSHFLDGNSNFILSFPFFTLIVTKENILLEFNIISIRNSIHSYLADGKIDNLVGLNYGEQKEKFLYGSCSLLLKMLVQHPL